MQALLVKKTWMCTWLSFCQILIRKEIIDQEYCTERRKSSWSIISSSAKSAFFGVDSALPFILIFKAFASHKMSLDENSPSQSSAAPRCMCRALSLIGIRRGGSEQVAVRVFKHPSWEAPVTEGTVLAWCQASGSSGNSEIYPQIQGPWIPGVPEVS